MAEIETIPEAFIPKDDKGCKRAKDMGYEGPCLNCQIDPCVEALRDNPKKLKITYLPNKDRRLKIRLLKLSGYTDEYIAEEFGLSVWTVRYTIEPRGKRD